MSKNSNSVRKTMILYPVRDLRNTLCQCFSRLLPPPVSWRKAVAVAALALFSAPAFAAFAGTPDGICYIVADRPGEDNAYTVDIDTVPIVPAHEKKMTEDTGVNDIEASEFEPVSEVFYAWNEDDFGIIDTTRDGSDNFITPSGEFDSLNSDPGDICGYQGGTYVCVDVDEQGGGENNEDLGMDSGYYDVDGLALNPANGLWFAAIRIDEGEPIHVDSRPDWLAVHDDQGVFDPDFFGTTSDGPVGFVEIDILPAPRNLHDIDDLGFNPDNGALYGVANVGGSSPTVIVEIFYAENDGTSGSTTDLGLIAVDGSCNNVAPDVSLTDVEGLSVDANGNIFGVTGIEADNGGGNSCLNNSMYFFGTVSDLVPGGTNSAEYLLDLSETDHESISCSDYPVVSVGDKVYLDADGNGAQDPGEPGIGGVKLNIYNENGDLIASQFTDSNGDYLFPGLVTTSAGGFYRVEVDPTNFDPGGPLYGYGQTADPDEQPGACTTCNNEGTTTPLTTDGASDLLMDFGYRGFDRGDNPDTYGLAAHVIFEASTLGTIIDAELTQPADANADLDDTTPGIGPDDEDGVTFESFFGAGFRIDAHVSGNIDITLSPAKDLMLCGWLDGAADGFINGTFEQAVSYSSNLVGIADPVVGAGNEELCIEILDNGTHDVDLAGGSNPASATCTTTAGAFTCTLTFNPDFTNPNTLTYARFRVTTDESFFSNTSPSPTGDVIGGEVEDYRLDINPTAVTIGKVELAGETVTDFLDSLGADQLSSTQLLELLEAWNPAMTSAQLQQVSKTDLRQNNSKTTLSKQKRAQRRLQRKQRQAERRAQRLAAGKGKHWGKWKSLGAGYVGRRRTPPDSLRQAVEVSAGTTTTAVAAADEVSAANSEPGREELLQALRDYLDPDGDGEVAVLRWDTLEERGTVGFYVERSDDGADPWVRINNDLLPGLITAPMGGEYQLADPAAQPAAVYHYRLIELEARGKTIAYGPFTVEMSK